MTVVVEVIVDVVYAGATGMFGVVGVVSYYVEIGGTVTLTDKGVVEIDVEAFAAGVTGIYVIYANVKVGTGSKMELVGLEGASTGST